MARLQTSGTRNCGIISLSCFEKAFGDDSTTVGLEDFHSSKIMNTLQPNAQTENTDFDELMEFIKKDEWLCERTIICSMSQLQAIKKEKLWHKKLKKNGFKLVKKFRNKSGSGPSYFYMRIPLNVGFEKGERS